MMENMTSISRVLDMSCDGILFWGWQGYEQSFQQTNENNRAEQGRELGR